MTLALKQEREAVTLFEWLPVCDDGTIRITKPFIIVTYLSFRLFLRL